MKIKSIFAIILLIIICFIVLSIINNVINDNVIFTGTVLENMTTSILVEPIEGESELSSSDKIVVRVPQKNDELLDLSQFSIGSKVVITYNGLIMESYPAQINAKKIKYAK